MADETPRRSTKGKKSYLRASFLSYPESPLGATPRPDLYQHYPSPPPEVELKKVTYSHREYTTDIYKTGSNNPDFTQLKKKTVDVNQVREWTPEYRDLKPEGSTRKALLIILLTFIGTLASLVLMYSKFSWS